MTDALDDAAKDTIQGAYRAWLAAREFKPRRGQRELIAHVARTIAADDNRILVAEAGTGTGKTAAYCLAAIPLAQALGKTVVISTATVALQEQVTLRDLPDLTAHAGLEFTMGLAKGRGRYVCLKRLEEQLTVTTADRPQSTLFEPPDPRHRALYEDMLTGYAKGTWNGESDTWPDALPSDAWSSVTTDHRGCSKSRCSFFQQCAFFKARAAIDDVDVIVANHDLVLADLRLGGGVVLPDPEDVVFIIDEAHHLPEKTQQHFSARVRLRATAQWLDQLTAAVGTMAQRFGRPGELVGAAEALSAQAGVVSSLLGDMERLVAGLEFGRVDDARDDYRFAMGTVPEAIAELCAPLADYFGGMGERLDSLHAQAEEALDGSRQWSNATEAEDWLPVLGQLASRALAGAALFADFAGAEDERLMARWVTRHRFEVGEDYELTSVPLRPGGILNEVLWDTCYAAICTSATLCALGRFDRFLDRAGLPAGTATVRIASPFEYSRIATFAVPAMTTDPRQAAAHTAEIARLLPDLLELSQSALVLFTSWRQLREVREALPAGILARCQIQGEHSKQALISRHREAIDDGETSYIFGLQSFAEGVDLPDDYCRHVILTKLPFSVPDDPVDQAFGEWLAAQGKNPFFEVAVPDAALRLVQACGRLIRHEDDHGRITLLDRRIVSLRYGRALLDSLPDFRREIA